jgi:hypothetical protein
MGRNSTFKKRRHSYKAALALDVKVRGIVTNFVVYYRIELQLAPRMHRKLVIHAEYIILDFSGDPFIGT